MLPSAPTANAASIITSTTFTANWSASSGATTYYLDVSTSSSFTTFVAGYNNLNVGNVTSYHVTGLACNYMYYYRVRAGNACGTSANSNIITVFTGACGPTCGSQVWMASNMNVGTMINGNQEQNNNSIVEKYCYNDVSANCNTYGGLYQWAEAMQIPYTYNSDDYPTDYTCDPCGSNGRQGICPPGYHIPTDLEWSRYEWCIETTITPSGSTTLNIFQSSIGGRGTNSNAGPGAKMKTTSWGGTNASGFSALPAGYRYTSGLFYNLGNSAFFWSATESSNNASWSRDLSSGSSQSYRENTYSKAYGFSVRCLEN